jgi:PAS domain S-box-containing protein
VNELLSYVFSPLREGDIALYRGSGNGLPPILLVAAEETSSLGCVERLEHEYALKAELDVDWAARPVALTRYNDRMTLVLEDPGGAPADRLLGRPLEVSHFLSIAIPLAGALCRVHERGLIHKDIKPANILVDAASGGVWLTGFGIASRLPREHQAPAPPEVIAGTLAYMAPEQTGRMNRSVDSRSDLYALGVTFYEMLTGTLPFTAVDPMEWVHCHIARQPLPPNEQVAGVPGPLSAIVMKLLAKTAEDRYQTATGLASDLRRCLAEWEATGRIEPFPLGARDAPDRLLIPERLYGREREIDTLLASFDRVVGDGIPELVLVSGYSGIGKSSVVNELHKVLVAPRGLFASGKFDQYKRDIPYTTLGQAFQSLVRSLLSQSEAELGRWRDSLSEALGPNGQLIVNLVPELELVIGKQPAVADLPPQDAQNRFQMVFRRFLGVFARKEHPLALFLDDLQWLDAATLDLLEHLVTHSEVRHLLLVGAYRDNEIGPAHPLLRTLDAIRDADVKVREIVLAPLERDDVGRLMVDALHCEPERARPLAELVQEKTGGNPFFAIQFFIALADEGLLAFDPMASAWRWDMDRIRAKSYTDNVVDLMAEKLKRLTSCTQAALKQLACLGNVAPIATLALVLGKTEESMHGALWEAVHAGLVFRENSAYKFLHDRIQQAAYSLIPDEQRADVHLRVGRVLLASMTADELAEHLFDVANQFNRGATRLIDRDEKAQVAVINLRAGRKAKASAAYASAGAYFSAGMALLDERDWCSPYELTFSLWLERAECELLSGNFDTAEQLMVVLLQRGASKVDQAAAHHLKVQLHVLKSENPQAVASALSCLQGFSIDLPAHPTFEQVQAEYETVWQTLNGRSIESLIDLPLITDPEMRAAMDMLSALIPPAYFTDFHLYCLLVCRMVNVSMQHGTSGASAHAYGRLGTILGTVFHRYREGYRFAQLACDLVEKHRFIAYRAKVHHMMGWAAIWTQPIATAIDFNRAAFRAASETGDLTYACYGMFQSFTGLLLRNDPLDAVWRESEMGLDFARKARYGDVVDIIVSQQRFIAAMRGHTATFATFSDAQFDEATFEAQLTGDRLPRMICWYWILKLKARFLAGDYAEALVAADKAKALLWASPAHIQLLDYFYYTALTVAALYENATADEQNRWRELLTAHREQLREWADNYPPTFADKHALVLAEIARLEGRDADAMHLYEQAIRSAREQGFVQNEGLAHEVAARFYTARGFETFANAYLREARRCYFRWGAAGKVRQLEQLHPHLRDAPASASPTTTIGTPVEQLDVGTVVKASHTVSGEIELGKLIETLLRIAVEHAGAERGLLILFPGDEARIAAEATTGRGQVEVTLRQTAASPAELPESVLHYVIRARESVILDDALAQNPFSADEYICRKHARSVLCLPLVKQSKLIGVLYLENNLASHVFTPARISVLELLASQAAISLENARLYNDLQEREAKIRRLVDSDIIGVIMWDLEGPILDANEAFLHMVGYSRDDLVSSGLHRRTLTPAEWDYAHERAVAELRATGSHKPFEKEYFRKDGSRVPVLIGGATFEERRDQGVSFVLDLTERKRAESALQQSEAYLAQAQELSRTGSFGWSVATGEMIWSEETFRIFQCDRQTKPTLEVIFQRTHPEDRTAVQKTFGQASSDEKDFDHEYRLLMPDDSVKHVHAVARAVRAASGSIEFVGAVTDVTAAKEAERKLRRSEAYLAEAQHLSHTSSWAWDVRRREFVYRSAEVYNLFGFDPEKGAVPLQAFRDRILPEDRPRNIEAASRAIREKADFEVDFRVALPDGSIKRIHSVGHPVLSSDGDVIELIGTHVDVTEQYAAKEMLQKAFDEIKKSEDRLRLVTDTIPTLVWRAGPEGNPDFLNQPALDYTGLSLDQAAAGWPRAFHPDDMASMLEKWSAIRKSGVRGELEARLRRFDGEYRWFLFQAEPLRDELGNIVKWYGSSTDIEDRKRTEEALRESEQRFRDYAETASDWLWETGPDHRVTRVSEHLNAVGIVPSRLTGVARWDVATDVESEPEKWRLHRAMHDEHRPFRDFVYRTVSGNGSPVYVRTSGKPFFDAKGNFLGYRGTGTDITATIRANHAEEALRKAQAELAHVTRVTTLGEMTASIAHEVNQPLAAVVNAAAACRRWLDGGTPNLEEARSAVDWIIKEGNRASEVIRRVRALANKSDIEKVPLDVNDVVRETIALVQRELISHQVSLRMELAPALPMILGERVPLQQVIINLVMNGIEAMQSVMDRPRELAIGSHQDEAHRVLVTVTDSGVGISAENADRLFNAFFTTKSSGMGMGLSICRSIIEAHGGRMSAVNNVGPGATFQFVLPLHQEDAS